MAKPWREIQFKRDMPAPMRVSLLDRFECQYLSALEGHANRQATAATNFMAEVMVKSRAALRAAEAAVAEARRKRAEREARKAAVAR